MKWKLNGQTRRIIRRSISFALSFVLLVNEFLIWNTLENVPIIGDLERYLNPVVFAAEDPGDDPEFPHNSDNTIEVDITDFVEYSAACQRYSTYHQNDKIIIVAVKSVSDYFEAGFQGIGTMSKPFAGSIELSPNTSAVLNLDGPLFKYVYDSVKINNGNPFEISRFYSLSDTDKTTPVIAEYVVHDSTSSALRSWNIDLVKPSDFNQSTDHNLGDFGGFIGNMCYDSQSDSGAKLSVSVTMNTSGTDTGSIALVGDGDLGLACGHMQKGTELTFAITGNRSISSLSSSGGDIGGLVGEMEEGSILNYSGNSHLESGVDIKTTQSGCYAGGVAGKNVGGTVSFDVSKFNVKQDMTGKSGSGGVYGYYKPTDTVSFDVSKYSIDCQVNGTGGTGGLFGVLDSEYDITISGSGTVKSDHHSGSCDAFGGLIGKYNPDSLSRTLTISGVTTSTSKSDSAKYYGGCIGSVDGGVQSYVKFNSVTVSASNADTLVFGGLVAFADNSFVDVDGAKVTAGDFKGGGIVGSLDHGILRLDGAVDLVSASPAGNEPLRAGKVVGWRDDALVFAKSSCSLSKANTSVDDIGSWGQVITFTSETSSDVPASGDTAAYTKTVEQLGGSEVISVNESTHAVTVASPSDQTNSYKTIAGVADYAKTALCFQIDASNNDFISFEDTSYTYSNIGAQNISLSADVDLSGTGFVNLTRDNDNGAANSAAKCTYSGTFDGARHTVTYGGSSVYRHSYTGLVGIASNATIQNATFAGTLNAVSKKTKLFVGSAAGTSTGTFTASSLDVNTTINHGGDSTIYVGGVLGEASEGIGNITVSNIAANATITGNASSTCLGGVIGKISHATNTAALTWSFSNIDISGTISNTTAQGKNEVGGLIATIAGGTGKTSRALLLNGINVKGLNINVSSNNNGSVGGVLGYSWASVNADFDEVEVGSSSGGSPVITQTKNSATGVDYAGLVYSGSGYWTIKDSNDLKITALKLSSESAQSFGMIVNRGWIGNGDMTAIQTALYLELQNASAYSINASDVEFKKPSNADMTIPVFDELVAHTAFYTGSGASKVAYSDDNPDNLYILQNGQGIVSIKTSNPNGGLIMDGTSVSGTYTPATSYGKQMNPFARYYYNLDLMKDSSTGAAGLMSWGAKWYAHESIKSDVSANTGWGATIPNGTYDLRGYSWYPLNIDTASVTINGTFIFYNKEFEDSEAAYASGGNHASRTSLFDSTQYTSDGYGTTQHYLMHSALLNNVRGKISSDSITLKGSVPLINTASGGKYSGALVLGTVMGSGSTEENTAKVTTQNVVLDGIYVHNLSLSGDYAPLLINKTDSYSTLAIRGVKVASVDSYKNNTSITLKVNNNPKAATSLIGNVGGSKNSKNINVSFSSIKLDGRKENLGLTDLDSAYHTDVSIFTKATLLNRLCFDTGKGIYTFRSDDDWNSGAHSSDYCVTYGKELGYTSSDSTTQYPNMERWYINTNPDVYVNPTTISDGTGLYSATFVSSYYPYVYEPYDAAEKHYQLEVNHSSSEFGGCGTYNDPYTITSDGDFEKIYDILANKEYSSPHTINLPMSNATTANLSATWHDSSATPGHKKYIYDVDAKEFYLEDNTNVRLSVDKVRTYVAGAYYLIKPAGGDSTITITGNTFKGLGNTTDKYAQFRGVIVGTGNETIINKTGYPLIAYSNGSVVKDINIEVDMNTAGEGDSPVTGTIAREMTEMTAEQTYDTADGKNYGAVMGSVIGGDNIIDGVTVSFKNTRIQLSGNKAQLIPVGGYVGVVLYGGVIFRGMEGKTSGISGIPTGVVTAGNTPGAGDASLGDMTAETNTRWLYVNPIIGRVINGYAVTESSSYRPYEDGTRVYHGGARTLDDGSEDTSGLVTEYWAKNKSTGTIGVVSSETYNSSDFILLPVTMRNGNKNYSIADINPNESGKLNTKGTDNYVEVPNGQAFFIMSLVVNSGISYRNLGYNTGYQTSRWAKYNRVSTNTGADPASSDYSDYNDLAKNDTYTQSTSGNNKRRGYLWNDYTINNTAISNTNVTVKLTTENGYYYLPDSYKGLGNLYNASNDYYRMKITDFIGNKATVSQNTTFYYYFTKSGNNSNLFDANYTPLANVGLGLINYQNANLTATDLTLMGNVITEAIDQTSSTGSHVPYYGSNNTWDKADNGTAIDSQYMASAGSFIGRTASVLNFTDVILDNVNVRGLKAAGGLLGYSTAAKVTINENCDSNNIKVHSAGNAGGLIGRKTVGAAYVDFTNHHFNLTEVVGESIGYGGGSEYDANYSVGGLIGGARCDVNTSNNAEKIYVFKNINIGDDNKTDPITIKCENANFFTGGLIGTCTRAALEIDNCHIYNLNLTSKYYAGGLIGQVATVPNSRGDGRDYRVETKINNCSIERNQSSQYGQISSTGTAAGGFIGAGKNDLVKDVILTNCYISGITVSSKLYTGGVAGIWGYVANNNGADNGCLVLNNFSISDCVLKGDNSVGGLVGVLNELHQKVGSYSSKHAQYLKGYNVLAKNLDFRPYTNNAAISYKGYICGFNEKVIQIAGFSRQDDRQGNQMIPDLVGVSGTVQWQGNDEVITESSNIFGNRTYNNVTSDGYVIFADYNDCASSAGSQNKLFANIASLGTNVLTMRSVTTAVVENYEDGVLISTDRTVSYGDYNPSGAGETITYSEGYEEGVTTTYTKTTTTVANENFPYVTSSPKFQIDGTSILTGDGVSSAYYNSSAFKRIIDDRADSSNVPKAYTICPELTQDKVTYISSEFSDSTTEFKNYMDSHLGSGIERFPLLIAEDTNKESLTELINNYLRTLTNTDYNYADTSKPAVFEVGLYKCKYNENTRVFDIDTSSSCLKLTSSTISGQTHYYFKMEASDVDTQDIPQFSLIDVMFKDPNDSTKTAYHLYVPVYVKKVLRFNFNAEIKSGSDYYRDAYSLLVAGLTNNTRTQGLFENLGNPVTIAFEYQYTRTAEEWIEAINSGDSVLTNYYKSLTIKNHNANNWAGITRMVLVDANNSDRYYYLDTPPSMNSTSTTYISLYDFKDADGTRFAPAPLQNTMTVTVKQSNEGTLTPTANNTATGATVFDGTTYYRPITSADTALADSDKYTVTSVTDISPERYYLTIFTKADASDQKVYRYEISSPETFYSSGTGTVYTDTNWTVDDWRANKIEESTVLNLFIGDIYENDLTIDVESQKGDAPLMASDNRYLDITMTANVSLTQTAIDLGIGGNMRSFQNKAYIYQGFLMMYDKRNADGSSEMGIDLAADGSIGNDMTYFYKGGNIDAADFDISTATPVAGEAHSISQKYVELANSQNLISELSKAANQYAVTLQANFKMVYAPNDLSLQFPKKDDTSSAEVGSSVIGYSKIASTVDGLANSAAQDKKTDPEGKRYYTSDESTASLRYNVVTSPDVAGIYHSLGINPVETGDDECYVDTYAVYDTRELKSTGDYIEITLTLSNKSSYVVPTVGNPVNSGTALPISRYLTDLKIYGAGDAVIFEQGASAVSTETRVTTDGSTIYKVRVHKSLLKTQTEGVYYIPVDFKAITGDSTFNNSGNMYANYKVTLTAAMYSSIDSAESTYLKTSYAWDHIIYTDARVIPEVIDN